MTTDTSTDTTMVTPAPLSDDVLDGVAGGQCGYSITLVRLRDGRIIERIERRCSGDPQGRK